MMPPEPAQAPQFPGSVLVSVQVPEQLVSPVRQETAQAPAPLQTWPAGQA